MKLRKRVAIGIIAGVLLALLLNIAVEGNREVMDEKVLIAESGYRYAGETVVPEVVYTEILSYLEHFKPLGDARLFGRPDEGMVLIRYNFLSSEYYPELTQVGMVGSLKITQSLNLVLKITTWFLAPGLLCLVIIVWPAITKETEEK